MTRYASSLSSDIAAIVQAEVDKTPREQYAVNEELAIKRIVLQDLLKLWSDAKSSGKADLALAIGDKVDEALDGLSIFANRAVDIDSKIRDRVAMNTLKYFMEIVLNLAKEIFDDGTHEGLLRVTHFEERLTVSEIFQDSSIDELVPVEQTRLMLESVPMSHTDSATSSSNGSIDDGTAEDDTWTIQD